MPRSAGLPHCPWPVTNENGLHRWGRNLQRPMGQVPSCSHSRLGLLEVKFVPRLGILRAACTNALSALGMVSHWANFVQTAASSGPREPLWPVAACADLRQAPFRRTQTLKVPLTAPASILHLDVPSVSTQTSRWRRRSCYQRICIAHLSDWDHSGRSTQSWPLT